MIGPIIIATFSRIISLKTIFKNIFTRNIYTEAYFSRPFYTIFERYKKRCTRDAE
jgi:hypothetical protein